MPESILNADDMKRTLGRMAHEVLEKNKGAEGLAVIGILSRGLPVAKRLAFAMTQIEGTTIPCGGLDIRRFRDDASGAIPASDGSEIPFAVEGKIVVLVDEVIQTGRTIRAALEAVVHYGRPASVQLAVLVDRGGRELPIEPNYVGKFMSVEHTDHVEVRFAEVDGEDGVLILEGSR